MHPPILYQIALTLISGIGPVKAKNLLAYCGSAEAIFHEKPSSLQRIPDVGPISSKQFSDKEILLRAESEVKFMEENHVIPLFYSDPRYPQRLKNCEDGPILLYTKGKMELNEERVISIVGTRTASHYGKVFVGELLKGITAYQPLIVSGLAYGIDICAHRQSVALNIQNVGCVAHGLDKIYPSMHIPVANEMMRKGGLITEFPSFTRMTPELFPMRNRIIAGLSDCTIVAETDEKGGSMITAHIANSYAREVFALPGRYNDAHSAGCNLLIKKNIAAIITKPADLVEYMNWDVEKKQTSRQIPLFPELNHEEMAIVKILQEKGKTDIDNLSIHSSISFSQLSNLLLNLEFKGVIRSIPGKQFEVNS